MSVFQAVERVFAYFEVADTERNFLISNVQQWAVIEGHTSVLVDIGRFSKQEPPEDPMVGIPLVNPVQKKDMGSLPVREFHIISHHKIAESAYHLCSGNNQRKDRALKQRGAKHRSI